MKARTFTFDSVKCLAIVSDSHGLLRDSVTAALQDVDLIIHAGDLGSRGVLERLEAFAPVIAVRGNVDSELIDLPLTEAVSVNDHLIYVLHDLCQLDLDPATAGIEMIVHGHSHQPRIDRRHDVLYVNPGSIGPRRFRLPVSMAKVTFDRQELAVHLVDLEKKGPQG
ncbi:MAG: metallophosphoesterase family protein [Verrucomicrobia bacterium]|nr:metallophosphoesterase family protein [Verrucomicrobiota bacterium]